MELIRHTKDLQDHFIDDLGSLPDLKLLTYEELEELTGLSRKTIDEWRKNWDFPYIQRDKHCQIYFPVGEIRDWLQDRVEQQKKMKKSDDVVEDIKSQSILK